MSAPKSLREFAELVERCRKAQRRYFREKKAHPLADHSASLAVARRLEAEVDRAVAAVLFQTPALPGMEGGGN